MGKAEKKKEEKMPERITIFTNQPHIQDLWDLCKKLNISLNSLIKEMIQENYPIQKAILEKQLEQKEELEEFKQKIKGIDDISPENSSNQQKTKN